MSFPGVMQERVWTFGEDAFATKALANGEDVSKISRRIHRSIPAVKTRLAKLRLRAAEGVK
jgi:hypothetical protein